jgi:hypothetical protein
MEDLLWPDCFKKAFPELELKPLQQREIAFAGFSFCAMISDTTGTGLRLLSTS